MNIQTFPFETTSRDLSAYGPRTNGISPSSGRKSAFAQKAEELNALKEKLSEQLMAAYGGALSPALVRQAVREADSIASTTPFPALFLPSLAEEKVRLAQAWSNRQRIIHEQTMAFAA